MLNNGFISQTYLKSICARTKRENIEKPINGIRAFFEDVRPYVEQKTNDIDYSLDEYLDDFIISSVGSLFRYDQVAGSSNKFILFADSAKVKPIGTLFAIHFTEEISSEVKGKNYGYAAVQLACQTKVRWAFLTNGLVWRIYDTQSASPYETYLEMDLNEQLISKAQLTEDAASFSIFCKANSYYAASNDIKSQIDSHFENSNKEIEKLESVLKSKIEKIVTDISYGFIKGIGEVQYSDLERRKIFEDSIILLYRMLFIQYAESRSLLPMENETYVEQSFNSLAHAAKDLYHSGELVKFDDSYDLWRKLDQLRGYINSGWDDIDMKAYNGGLFDNEYRDILNSYSISDSYFAEVLCELSFVKDKNGRFTDRIEYKDLSVRNLGALYEGLLEFNLFIADQELVRRTAKGKVSYIRTSETTIKKTEQNSLISEGEIYLSQDALERKESGSYYTPEDVVNYIIENTVGKKLEERKNKFKQLLDNEQAKLVTAISLSEKQAIYNSIDKKVYEFIQNEILTLSVLDNSMGSGHFLVNTAYYISNFIMELVHSTDWESEYLNGSLSYWKIQVVSHCIFGVDINPLALHLGKLSLWLVSAAKNKPLSFMDHHLKVGNSLIGIDKKSVLNQINDWVSGEHDIFTVSYNNVVENVLNKYRQISKMPEDTKDQVHAKKDLYDEITIELDLLKKKFDVYLSMVQIDGKVKEGLYLPLLGYNELEFNYYADKYEEYLMYAYKQKYFHWDLEYPDVMEAGGFDIVLGNPPYVMVSNNRPYNQSIFQTLQTNNLYCYMMERAIKHTRIDGKFGVIVPISSVSGETMLPLQNVMLNSLSNLYISNYSTRPSKLFHNVEQRLSIIFGTKTINENKKCDVFTTSYIKWFSNERINLFKELVTYTQCQNDNIGQGLIPKIGNLLENEIFSKIKRFQTPLKSLTSKDGEEKIFYHSAPRYWIKAMNYLPRYYSNNTGEGVSSKYKGILFENSLSQAVFGCIMNSNLFYWWWNVVSDCRDLTRRDIMSFPFDIRSLNENLAESILSTFEELMKNYNENKFEIQMNLGGNAGTVTLETVNHQKAKPFVDKIDRLLAKYYDFSEEELIFITNYDHRFKMGREGNEDE